METDAVYFSSSGKKQNKERLRREIDGILQTLSPSSASQALQSLVPLLQELSNIEHNASNSSPTKYKSPHQPNIDRYRNRKLQHSPTSLVPRTAASTLPSITSMLAAHYRKQAKECHSAASVGSSSDSVSPARTSTHSIDDGSPIYERERSSSTRSGTSRPTYNANAAVSFMKLERNSRRPDYSSMWNWKDGKGDDESSILTDMDNKSKLEQEITDYLGAVKRSSTSSRQRQQVQGVQRVKQLYFAGTGMGSDCDDASLASSDVSEFSRRTPKSSNSVSSGRRRTSGTHLHRSAAHYRGQVVLDPLKYPTYPTYPPASPTSPSSHAYPTSPEEIDSSNYTGPTYTSISPLKPMAPVRLPIVAAIPTNDGQYLNDVGHLSAVSRYVMTDEDTRPNTQSSHSSSMRSVGSPMMRRKDSAANRLQQPTWDLLEVHSGTTATADTPDKTNHTHSHAPLPFSFSLDSSITHVEFQSDGDADFQFSHYQFSPPSSSPNPSLDPTSQSVPPTRLDQDILLVAAGDNQSPLMKVNSMVE